MKRGHFITFINILKKSVWAVAFSAICDCRAANLAGVRRCWLPDLWSDPLLHRAAKARPQPALLPGRTQLTTEKLLKRCQSSQPNKLTFVLTTDTLRGVSPPLCCLEASRHFCLIQTLAEFYSLFWAIVWWGWFPLLKKLASFLLALVSHRYVPFSRSSRLGVIPLGASCTARTYLCHHETTQISDKAWGGCAWERSPAHLSTGSRACTCLL